MPYKDPVKRRIHDAVYRKRNRKRISETDARFRRRHHKRLLKKARKFRRDHPEWRLGHAEWVQKNPKRRAEHTKRNKLKKYGLTLDQFNALCKKQQGRCAICRKLPKADQVLHVDHDHKTRRVRGLLCPGCNRGIGMLQDSSKLLRRALVYLERSHVIG